MHEPPLELVQREPRVKGRIHAVILFEKLAQHLPDRARVDPKTTSRFALAVSVVPTASNALAGSLLATQSPIRQMQNVVAGMVGKRLMYRDLVG